MHGCRLLFWLYKNSVQRIFSFLLERTNDNGSDWNIAIDIEKNEVKQKWRVEIMGVRMICDSYKKKGSVKKREVKTMWQLKQMHHLKLMGPRWSLTPYM